MLGIKTQKMQNLTQNNFGVRNKKNNSELQVDIDEDLKVRPQNTNVQTLQNTPSKIKNKTKNLDTIPVMSISKGFIQFPEQNQNIMVQTQQNFGTVVNYRLKPRPAKSKVVN